MLVIHVALISMGVMIAAKLARPDWMPRYGYALLCVVLLNTSTISTTALFQNQPQILVTFLVLLAVERHLSGASRLAGCALALAAAIKVGPALLALIFLARGDRRALVWFLGIGASLAACSVIVAGWPAHQVFLHRLAQIDGVIALTQVNMAFDAVTYEIGTVFGWWPSPFAGAAYGLTIDQPKVIGLALRGVLILGAIALWRGQLRRPGQDNALAGFIALFILVKLTGPLAWSHHFLLVLLLLPGLFRLLPTGQALALNILVGVALSQTVFGQLLATGSSVHLTSITGAMIISLVGLSITFRTVGKSPDRSGAAARVAIG